MIRINPIGLLSLYIVLIIAVSTLAAVPQTVNYQGYLKDSAGVPVSAPTSVRFSLYSSNPARNNPVWSETKSVTPSNGIYSTQLGSATPINAPFDVPYWLGVKVAGDGEMPLQPLSSAPYALRAATVDAGAVTANSIADSTITAAKLDTAYVKLAGDTMTGKLNLPDNGFAVGTNQLVVSGGKVGIGTGNPSMVLDVVGDFRVKDVGATYQYVYMGGGYNTRSPSCPCDLDPGTTDCVTFYSDTDLGLNCYDNFFDSFEGYAYLQFQRTTISPLFVISSNGNIGIKTSTPSTALDVIGTVKASSFSGSGAGLTNVNATTVINGVYTTGSYANPAWLTSLAAAKITGILPIASGGTGSATQNFVDLSSTQTAGGNKTFSGTVAAAQLTSSGNLDLPATTASAGIITQGGDRLIHTYGYENFFAGHNAGNLSTTGSSNAATGSWSLTAITTGTHNTATGYAALTTNTTGSSNTATGATSLYSNTTGFFNTATGAGALGFNTTGSSNTATGNAALTTNSTGSSNTASGYYSLSNNTTASKNTAVGTEVLALQSFNNGGTSWDSYNTAVGYRAIYSNQPTSTSNGNYNAALGSFALTANTTGYNNAAFGADTLKNNTTGISNTAAGYSALFWNTTGNRNTAVGRDAGLSVSTGSDITLLGYGANVSSGTLTNATAIGSGANVNASNKVRIGNGSVTVIEGQVGWSYPSDIRLKEDVREIGKGLDFITALRPVEYRLKNGNDRTDFGFIAQDLEELLGTGYNLLGIGEDTDRTLSLRYTDLIAPLVKAVQEQQATIEQLKAELAEIRKLLGR